MEKILENYISKTGRLKTYIYICVFASIIGILVSLYANHSIRSVDFYGHTYKIEDFIDGQWKLTSETNGPMYIFSEHNNRRLSYLRPVTIRTQSALYSIERDESFNILFKKEGQVIAKKSFITFSDQRSDKIPKDFENILDLLDTGFQSYLFLFISCNFIFIPLGTLNLVNPYFSWHMRMMFITKGGEPTDFYKTMTRIAGLIIIGIGIFYPLKLL